MNFDGYLEYKLNDAKNKVYSKFNRTYNFTKEDVISLLSDYGNTFESTLENISMFLPQKGNDFTDITSFTKGFIDNPLSTILVCVMPHKLNVFVVEFKNYLLDNYYSYNIDNSVMEILYQLEVMKEKK